MFNHTPPGYTCPFCRLAAGGEDEFTTQHDVVRRTSTAIAFVASRWWPNNQGHVHVFPRYVGDELNNTRHLTEPATAAERAPYVEKLRTFLAK
ncbi:hypothetical protein [Kribbella lupini]|uniref:HIT domain-containing protein n=1 Tax=Kribbella lupini TaxID=291602 RepID=A0ABP4MUF6_9ACTN